MVGRTSTLGSGVDVGCCGAVVVESAVGTGTSWEGERRTSGCTQRILLPHIWTEYFHIWACLRLDVDPPPTIFPPFVFNSHSHSSYVIHPSSASDMLR